MGVKICHKCGGKVSEHRDDCVHCGYIFPKQKECPDCGEKIDIGLQECPVCGFIFSPVEVFIEPKATVVEPKQTVEEKPKQVIEQKDSKETKQNNTSVEVEKIEKTNNEVKTVVCPYCGSKEKMQIGVDFYMCATCLGKFTPYTANSNTSLSTNALVEKNSNKSQSITTSNKDANFETEDNVIPQEKKIISKRKIILTVAIGVLCALFIVVGCLLFRTGGALSGSKYIDGNLYSRDGKTLFEYNSKQTEFVVPNRVVTIGNSAFSNCSSLESVTIGNSVTTIGDWAFYNCSSLTSITIPNSVTTIGDYAFFNCSSLTSVTIPDSVITIGDYAFYNCSSLTSITIPNSVTTIGRNAFSGCSSLQSITFSDSSNWFRTTSSTNMQNKMGGTLTDLSNPTKNVSYFKPTYYDYYWYKL